MSIAGGLPRAVERAEEVGATALQIFVKSASQWESRPLSDEEVREFRSRLRRSGLDHHTLAHASYLVNLASPDPRLWERSVRALAEELDRCRRLGIRYLVVHPGSHVGSGEEEGIERVARALDRLDRGASRGRVGVLLEITSGQGSALGSSFEQLQAILERARSAPRIGICFDTCHALAAGYDFRDEAGYRKTFEAVDRTVGLERLRAFHLNDSKTDVGSRRDRHEHIGRGRLGLEPFRRILTDRRFRDLPMVVETPKGEDLAEDRENLRILRELARA
jgi:deoxyribonuclease-4